MGFPSFPYQWTTSVQSESPAGDGVSITTKAGAYTNSDWVEVIAATPEAWSVTGVWVSANSAGITDTEVDIGIGSAGNEVVVATVGANQGSDSVIPLPVPGAWIPAGSRVALRERDASIFAGFIYKCGIVYVPSLVGSTPSVSTALKLTPTGSSGVTLTASATPWTSGSWTELVASTSSPWAIGLVLIKPVVQVGSVPTSMEIDLGTGGSGSELVLTTIRWASHINNKKSPCQDRLWPLVSVPASTRISARIRTDDSSTVECLVKLQYYDDTTGLSTVMTNQPTVWVPAAADSLSLVCPSSAWVSSPWVEYITSTSTPIAVTQIVCDGVPTSDENEIDIGVGPANSEVVAGTVRFAASGSTDNGSDNTVLTLAVAQTVPLGTRVSLRARTGATGGNTLTAALGYVVTPSFSITADNPQHVLPPASGGVSIHPASSSSWTNSIWGLLSAETPEPMLITGVSITNGATDSWAVDLGTGPSGSESVIGTVRMNTTTLTLLWFPCVVPIFVDAGQRLSIRLRHAAASTTGAVVAITYLSVPQPQALLVEGTQTPIRWLRQSPHVNNEKKRVIINRFELDAQVGTGRTNPPGDDPKAFVQWSFDGGRTWGNPQEVGFGQIGDYTRRMQVYRQGSGRDPVCRVFGSDPSFVALVDAYLDVEACDN